ncbi:hypothetical protein GF323_05145 [Candidatus Woesearchaeota archaeon]|nr:hypothetical protein [Candidatus Woesearchaeota archaeon]
MRDRIKPFLVVGVFWIVLFMFVLAGYSGSFGSITGFAVNENPDSPVFGLQSLAILILFFTNIVTLFFLVREMAGK